METHPAVARVTQRLAELAAAGTVRILDGSARTAAQAAAELGVDVVQIANSLVFDADDEPLLVMASGGHRVDTAKVATLVGAAAVGRATPDFVRTHTGFAIGGGSPVGHPEPLRTLVDTSLEQYDEVWAAAGHPHSVFPTTHAELPRLHRRRARRREPRGLRTLRMRVLFTSTWTPGHVIPMMPLARALLAAGHQVRWAAPEPACALIASAGIDAVTAGLSSSEVAAVTQRVHRHLATVPPPERAAYAFPTMFGELATPPMVRDLLPLARDWRPDLMVHEQAELGSALVGAVLGLPSVTHSFGGATPPQYIADAAGRLSGLWAANGLTVPPYAGSFDSLYLDICPTSMQTVPLDHVRARQLMRPVQDNGPSSAPLPAVVTAEDGRALVYLTLGTVSNRAPAFATAAAGLARLDARVLIATGNDGDPEGLGSMPSNVTVARWVDQAAVLPHCSVVVSHSGSGTFFGALARGLPQLCLPQAADQFRNSAAAVRSGVGLVLAGQEVTVDAVHDAVQRLLSEDAFRAAAQGVAAEIAAMPSPGDVVPVLEQLVVS